MTTEELARKLGESEGFKPLFKGLFAGGKVKKSAAIYSEADKKGVYQLHRLRLAKHEDSEYAVYAFCPTQEINPDTLKVITARVADIALGTIRYESTSYSRLQFWRGEEGSLACENTEITGIAPEYPDIFIFPVADQVNCVYVIYAQKGDQTYIYPITEEQASRI